MTTVLSKEEVEPIIRRLLSQASNQRIDAAISGQRLRDLGIDSLGRHAISVVMEAELGISLDPDLLEEMWADGVGDDLIACVLALQPKIQSDWGDL